MDRKRDKTSITAKIKLSRRLHEAMKQHYTHGNVPAYMSLLMLDRKLGVGHE
jgi:hypothetical protein